MIDSINLIIFNIDWLDFKYLRGLGIEIKSYNDRTKIYWFCYKNIEFKFCPYKRYLLIKTIATEILNKSYITISDKNIYKSKVLAIIKEVIHINQKINIYIERIDYAVDIKLEEDLIKLYISLLKKYKHKYKYMRLNKEYATSLYLKNKSGQFNFNFYNKFEESKKLIYKDILRIEIQVKQAKIKSEKKKNIDRTLDNYWTIEAMKKYYFDVLQKYIYNGKHYKKSIAKDIINKSDYSNNWKNKLKTFIEKVSVEGLYGIIDKKIYSRVTINTYINKLVKLNINPITLENNCRYTELENIYKLTKEIAYTKYFL